MNERVTLQDGISEAVRDILAHYDEEIVSGTKEIQKDIASEAVAELKVVSPKRKSPMGGTYAKNWRRTEESERRRFKSIVHNEKRYRLTHLLEFGHKAVNGDDVPAYPHIANVAERFGDKYTAEVERLIKGI